MSSDPHCEHCQPESDRAASALDWILRSVPEQYREDAAQALHDVGVPIEDLPADLRDDVRAFTSHHYSRGPM
ncbi:hypothetical protein EV383_4462 [Pseudonocardia sediminis]|uniref:Uncharacterized protein n=1 Tax=Pseudonocardia sediminis TaxID=1397368 RepID=A0A4Q7UZF3_PSEST|nr:hypothetical protein [Pseudonocardia sediminis]RZT87537.1 hypothetical protein EV383_4462 [Pseudonocardia sediminis]